MWWRFGLTNCSPGINTITVISYCVFLRFNRNGNSITWQHHCLPLSVRFPLLILLTQFVRRVRFLSCSLLLLWFGYCKLKDLFCAAFTLLYTPAAAHNGSFLYLLFHLHLSCSSPSSVNSWLCMCCRSWNRRISSKRPRRVATGASWQKTTCCGGRNAGRKVSLQSLQQLQTDDMQAPRGAVWRFRCEATPKDVVVPVFKINFKRWIESNLFPSLSSQASMSLCPLRRGKSSSLASPTAPGRVPTSGSTE